MRIGRAFIMSAILALGVAGSALAGSAMAASGSVANAHPTGVTAGYSMYHHG